jgi:hypothetical protein
MKQWRSRQQYVQFHRDPQEDHFNHQPFIGREEEDVEVVPVIVAIEGETCNSQPGVLLDGS